VEFGTHEVLMAKNGSYSNLVNVQMKWKMYENEESVESDEEMPHYGVKDVKLDENSEYV